MIAANVNKEWAKKVSFEIFCQDFNIAKLSHSEQHKLWKEVTGKEVVVKEVKTNKGAGNK